MRKNVVGIVGMVCATVASLVVSGTANASASTTSNDLNPQQSATIPQLTLPLTLQAIGGTNTAVASPPVVDPNGCELHVMQAHQSTWVFNNHNQLATKVNAFIQCTALGGIISLKLELWKTGFFQDYLQPNQSGQSNTVYATGTTYLSNDQVWTNCYNTTASTYYGIGHASDTYGGYTYTAEAQSLNTYNWGCGTPFSS